MNDRQVLLVSLSFLEDVFVILNQLFFCDEHIDTTRISVELMQCPDHSAMTSHQPTLQAIIVVKRSTRRRHIVRLINYQQSITFMYNASSISEIMLVRYR